MAEIVEISIKKDGPYLVSGGATLLDTEGTPYSDLNPIVALCRCGLSKNRPFCDGSHSTGGFTGDEHAA